MVGEGEAEPGGPVLSRIVWCPGTERHTNSGLQPGHDFGSRGRTSRHRGESIHPRILRYLADLSRGDRRFRGVSTLIHSWDRFRTAWPWGTPASKSAGAVRVRVSSQSC